MPLGHLVGISDVPDLDYFNWINKSPRLDPKNVVLIGIRDIDPDEYDSLARVGLKCYTMDHIDQYGIGEVMRGAL